MKLAIFVALALVALFAAVSAEQRTLDPSLIQEVDIPKGLAKPIILQNIEGQNDADQLGQITEVLSKEPAAALTPEEENGEEAEESAAGESEESSADAAAAAAIQGAIDAPADEESGAESSKNGTDIKVSEHTAAPVAGSSSVSAEILHLKSLIANAKKISEEIPAKMKRLEELKKAQKDNAEKHAKEKALKALDSHKTLVSQMTGHIKQLQKKLAELQAKRDQLKSSDGKLSKEIDHESSKKEHASEESSKKESGEESSKKESGEESSKKESGEESSENGEESGEESSEEASESL